MKLAYYDVPSRAMINISPRRDRFGDKISASESNTYEVNRVSVPRESNRGKGIARRLMKELLTDADKEGVILYLYIHASGGLTYDQLAAWYERCGFVKQETGYYLREPITE